MNRWKRVASSLARLAQDQRNTPEGKLAGIKLRAILAKYPEARDYEPVRAFVMADLRYAFAHRDMPINITVHGGSVEDAVRGAFNELARQVDLHRAEQAPRKEIDG